MTVAIGTVLILFPDSICMATYT